MSPPTIRGRRRFDVRHRAPVHLPRRIRCRPRPVPRVRGRSLSAGALDELLLEWLQRLLGSGERLFDGVATGGHGPDHCGSAERTGLTAHTLRYTERDLGWIQMVTRLRSTGMPIREVRRYADLVRQGPGNEAERLDILRRHRERCGRRVDVLSA